MDLSPEAIRTIFIRVFVLVVAVCFHEFGHAYMATRLGDDTPRRQGRVTLNPLAHADPIGTLLLPIVGAVYAAMGHSVGGFGWGRPVQWQPSRVNRKWSMSTAKILVAFAGPAMNIVLAVLIAGIQAILVHQGVIAMYGEASGIMAFAVATNFLLFFFNLVPAPPLDGGHIAEGFMPYARDPQTLARPWAVPGTPGLEHRIGGIEKQETTGHVNYEPQNHERMVRVRAEKVARIAQDIPDVVPAGAPEGDLLIVGWGSTYGSITAALRAQPGKGRRVGHVHLRHLNPFPKNLGEVLKRYEKVLVPEMNLGQLVTMLRARYLVDAISYPKVQGQPFKQAEIEAKIDEILAAGN